jgi:hypothetical protein
MGLKVDPLIDEEAFAVVSKLKKKEDMLFCTMGPIKLGYQL